jgi:hypothetical protein
MTLRLAAFVFFGISSLLPAADNGLQVITLKDSSVIRAQVTEMSGGVYLVVSPTLGQIKIPTGDVVSIRNEGTAGQSVAEADSPAPAKSAAAQTSPAPASLESLRSALTSKVQSLVSTRDGMNAVTSFSNNPDLKAVMNDPQVMKAIQNGDTSALMKSPAMKTLLDNPQTQALIQSVLHSKPQDAPQEAVSPGEPAAPGK